jgi:biotin synthase
MGGANLLWAEVGANPRDIREKTEEGRGHTVTAIRKLFTEIDWQTLAGPSQFFTRRN